jgi:Ca2+-transporting ATPase
MYFDQFRDFMIAVLIAAAVISGIVGEPADAIAIVVIILLNGVIGVVQEFRAERAVQALRRLAAPVAEVVRDGRIAEIPSARLVPGDIVMLKAGDLLSADMRLLEAVELKVDEAALTGESEAVVKTADALAQEDLPLGDRINMGYKGTLVTHGRGKGLVVDTGMTTEIGRIAALLGRQEADKTPLQQRLARFGRRLAMVVLVICLVIFGAGLLRGEPLVLMFLTAVSLAVAAIPEALPAVVTISLALGTRKMIAQKALARRLPAVETLGSVTYICSDKTGTLTQNIMRAEAFYAAGERRTVLPDRAEAVGAWSLFAQALALSNDADAVDAAHVKGDPTEVALLTAAGQAGFGKSALAATSPRIAELPFDAERKRMTTLHQAGSAIVAYTKGAPEEVLPLCATQSGTDGAQPIQSEPILGVAEAFASEGYRVLAVAWRNWPCA